MYLMDEIAEAAKEIRDRNEIAHPVMGIYHTLAKELDGCPRFIFDNDAIHTAVELTLGRPKIILDAIKHLTIPYPKIWVEWSESGRERLREVFTESEAEVKNPNRPLPNKIGFFLKTDNGRRGGVYWAWNVPKNSNIRINPPNICPISPYFDLDREFKQPERLVRTFLIANIASLWKNNPIQQEALKAIWRTAEHLPSSNWGVKYLKYVCGQDQSLWDIRLNHFYADVYGEYIMIWAILLLLTSSRKIVEETAIDLSGLNKARKKRNQIPKYNYTKVNLYINPIEEEHVKVIRGPLGYSRKSPRIHLVSSFLNRRGNKHWVVQPFWRGKGELISRHVHVHSKPKEK